jgi:hypothetical protein
LGNDVVQIISVLNTYLSYLSSVSFTEHNKQLSHELGENGLFNAIKKLKDNSYIINEINDSDGNDIIAKLNI